MRAPILPYADFLNRYNEADFNLNLKKVEDQLSGPKYAEQNIFWKNFIKVVEKQIESLLFVKFETV